MTPTKSRFLLEYTRQSILNLYNMDDEARRHEPAYVNASAALGTEIARQIEVKK